MRRSRTPIALDVGEECVRALQLDQRGGTWRVRAAGAARIEPATTDDERQEHRIDACRRALRGRPFRGSSVIVALRLADITTRHLRIPSDKLDSAGEIIARQVQDPSNAGQELAICPLQVAELFDQGERKREFLCCIATSSVIRRTIDLVEAVGLVPEAIDLEPCALVRPFVQRAANESFLHLDIGREGSRITVVRAGSPVLMRGARVGSDELQRVLADRLQMDVDSLLDLGADPTVDPTELHATITGALAEPLEALLVRVADGVRYCGALFQGRAVNLMRVSGRLATLPGLVPYLGRRIGITAEPADPFAGITAAEPLPGFDTALGLALRGVAA